MRARIVAFVSAALLVSVACGARLDAKQRAVALQAYTGGGAGPAQATPAPGTAASGQTGTQTGGKTSGQTGGQQPGQQPGQQAGGSGCAPAPGGNKATDTGVAPTQVTIATVSDISGVQPGLFQSTHDAISAVAAYINSQGGICGRTVKPLLLDSQTNSGGNRSATLEACDKSFALVGSMSAFDQGGASEVDNCGIPDMTAISVNPQRGAADNTYAIYPAQNPSGSIPVGPPSYIKKTHPGVIKNAAMLWLDADVTRINAAARSKAWESIGFDFIYEQPVQVVEANYSSYVVEMKNHQPPIEYVDMVADYQSIVRLVQAMQQQDWYPEVMDWDSVVYDPAFLEQAQGAADGSLFFINTAMFEESGANAEMKLYLDWLARVKPGAEPDYFGMYAWSAGRLFQEVATEVGPNLTRKAFLAELRKVREWDGNGLHGPQNVGGKLPTTCFLYGEVRNSRFVRHYPGGGLACNEGGLVRV